MSAPPLQGKTPPYVGPAYPEQQPQVGHPPAQAQYPPQLQMGAYPQQPQGGYPVQPQGGHYEQPRDSFVQPPQYTQEPPQYSQDPQPYPGQAGYIQQEVTVVTHQPVSGVTLEQTRSQPELGIGAAVFAGISTACILSLGCWWGLPCTIVGIILGIFSATYGSNGDIKNSKRHGWISIGCTSFGLVFSVVGLIIIIVSLVLYFQSLY